MNFIEKKETKKIWVTPEIKKITGFNVHENVVATSEIIIGPRQGGDTPPPGEP